MFASGNKAQNLMILNKLLSAEAGEWVIFFTEKRIDCDKNKVSRFHQIYLWANNVINGKGSVTAAPAVREAAQQFLNSSKDFREALEKKEQVRRADREKEKRDAEASQHLQNIRGRYYQRLKLSGAGEGKQHLRSATPHAETARPADDGRAQEFKRSNTI